MERTRMDWFDTGKDLFNKAKKWGETIGDMTSAGINPVEKTDWMDEQQKKIVQQQKTLQPKTGIEGIPGNRSSAEKQADTFTPVPAPKPENDEPVTDWTGHTVSEEERQRILANRAQERANNSDDVNSVLDGLNKLRQEQQQDTSQRKAFRFDSDITEEKPSEPKPSAFEQAAAVNVPQDESMMPAFRHAGETIMKALGKDSAVSGYGRTPSGHSDLSYKSATDAAADNITRNLGDKSAVSGFGRAPVGHDDLSYDPAIGDISNNFGLDSAVTGKGRQVIGAPNMTDLANWDNEDARNMPLDFTSKGVQQGVKDWQILFYSGAGVLGENLFNLAGGDDTALKQAQGILDWHQKELKDMNRLMTKDIYQEDDPEKTMQNVTRYLYQELGNQTIKLPAYYVAAHLNTFATLFGVSSAVLSAQFYGDFREKTGDGHAAESVMYSIPLGLMSAALLPFRDSGVFQSAKEVKEYVNSMIVGAAVHKAQNEGRRKVVDKYGNRHTGQSGI